MLKLFNEPTITPAEAAARIGVPVPTVFLWLKKGVLRGWKVAGRFHIPETALEELVKDAKRL